MGGITNQARCVIAGCVGLSLFAAASVRAGSVSLRAYPEFVRVDPFGQMVKADRVADATRAALKQGGRSISLQRPRGGYVSFQLVAEPTGNEAYTLELRLAPGESGAQAEVYREWFHHLESNKSYGPDALIPIRLPYSSRLPEPDNPSPTASAM